MSGITRGSSDKERRIREDLTRASKPRLVEPSREAVGLLLSLINQVYRGELAEVKIISTRRGIDVLSSKKRRI